MTLFWIWFGGVLMIVGAAAFLGARKKKK